MPECFKVVCMPCKALYKCSALPMEKTNYRHLLAATDIRSILGPYNDLFCICSYSSFVWYWSICHS